MRLIYERHHSALYGYLRARTRSGATAMDVLQDAMMEVWRNAGTFSGRSSVRTWIFAIARNKLVDRQRRDARLSYTDELPEQIDDGPDPAAVIASAQDARHLRACLDRLKAAHLAAIRLAFFEELPYADIARIEAVPVGTVKTRIHHAKKVLMHCLGRPA